MHEETRVDVSLNAILPQSRTYQLLQKVTTLNNRKYPDIVMKTIIGFVTLENSLAHYCITCLEHHHGLEKKAALIIFI
jgi:hypothetical protein